MAECLQSLPVILEHQVDHLTSSGPADREGERSQGRFIYQFYQPAPTEHAVHKTFPLGGDCRIQELCHFHKVSGSEREDNKLLISHFSLYTNITSNIYLHLRENFETFPILSNDQ